MYNYLADIRSAEWLEYGVVLVVVMFLVTRIIKPTWLQLVALAIGALLIYYRTDRRKTTTARAFTELESRLQQLIPRPENFHIDVDILNLFYNTKEFRQYHPSGYDASLIAVDNMLKLVTEMQGGVYHCTENLQVVRDQMNKAMNHYQTIIFGLPTDLIFQRKHKRALNALHVLLRRHVDDMVEICIKQTGSGREGDRNKANSSASQFYSGDGFKETGSLDSRVIDINWHPIENKGPRPNDLQNAESSAFDFYY
jgi:hypothetical protein